MWELKHTLSKEAGSSLDISVGFEKASVVKNWWLEAKERPWGQTIGVEWGRINGTLWKQESESRTLWSRVRVPRKKPEVIWLNFVRKSWKAENRYFRKSSFGVVEGSVWKLCVLQEQKPAERIPPWEHLETTRGFAGLNNQCKFYRDCVGGYLLLIL